MDNLTVQELLTIRWAKLKEQNTAFGTYVQCITEMFEKKHREHSFRPAMVTRLQPLWKKITNDEKEPYRRLMAIENKLIDDEIKILDNIIIAKRPGPRFYTGFPPSSPTPEKDKDLKDKMAFCPTFWYMCATFRENVTTVVQYPWRNNVPQLKLDAINGWPSLSDSLKRRFIKRAKEEYMLFTGSSNGDDLVDEILLNTLQRRKELVQMDDDGAESLHSQIDQQSSQ